MYRVSKGLPVGASEEWKRLPTGNCKLSIRKEPQAVVVPERVQPSVPVLAPRGGIVLSLFL